MKIYLAHPRDLNYKEDLYAPLRKSKLNNKYEIVLPHEQSEATFNSKGLLNSKGIIIVAEVSTPSTGVGIELGWANANGNKIICVYKKGAKVSGSLKEITQDFIEYNDPADLVEKLTKKLET